MRLIDADVLFTDEQFEKYMEKILIEDGTGDVYIRPEDVADMIMEAHTIDAEPVVRCKECKWGKPYSDKQLKCNALGLGGLKFPDDFCSYGGRREP